MTPDTVNQLASWLLLVTLAMVLAVAALFVFLAVRTAHRTKQTRLTDENDLNDAPTPNPGPHYNVFDGSCRWMVIRSRNVTGVLEALHLRQTAPCPWEAGIAEHSDHPLFVSHPINGWILAVGPGLPDPFDEIDACFHLIRDLSSELGCVQFFSATPILDHHAWAWADEGRILRAYARADETLWNQGMQTRAERDLGFECYDYLEPARIRDFSLNGPPTSHSEMLFQLAARWSLNPRAIRTVPTRANRGISGRLTHFEKH